MSAYAQKTDGGSNIQSLRAINFVKTRLSVSPVLGFYATNKKHATAGKQKMSFAVSTKAEIRLTKHYRDFLLVGAEYMQHGVNFNSYFFYPDSIQLYTANRLRYTYNATIHEFDFPILVKHSFDKESNSIFSKYIFAGYNFRWLAFSKLKVEDNGAEIYTNNNENITFKQPVFSKRNNSFITIGAGFQRNTPNKNKAVFAEIQFKYGLSPLYINNSYSPSSLYINSHFLYITVGVKI